MKKVLIFDFDGVIVDSLENHLKNFNDLCKEMDPSLSKTKEEYLDMMDGNFHKELAACNIPKDTLMLLRKRWKERAVRDVPKVPMFDGIRELLVNLSKEHIMFIVTSNYTKIIEEYVNRHDMPFFEDILDAEYELSKTKKIISIKEKHPQSEIFFICDTKGDIKEGKEARVITIAATWGWHNRERLLKEAPDHIFDTIEELRTFLIK